jgi:hypothetical protein
MAGINVNQLTSMLAKLQPDSALQKYALDNKNDPYIVSLAASESNRRKELRAASQGAQGMQQQPKVADAAIAQMAPQQLPEQMGIGQLPAQNMQQMADGGIAGYEGYDEGGMTYGQDPVMMMAEGGVARYQVGGSIEDKYRKESMEMGEGVRMQYSPDVQAYSRAQEQASRESYAERERQRMLQGPYAAAPLAAPTPSPTDPSFRRQQDPRMKPGVAATAQPLITSDIAAPIVTGQKTPTRKATAPAAAAPPPAAVPEQSAAARFMAMQTEMGVDPNARTDIDARRDRVAETMRAQSRGEMDEFEKDVAARGEAFKGREARLAKREAGLDKRKDENTGLALLEAGLAIMSTPGKLAEAVGKGAQVGLRTYGAGLSQLRAAQEKMDDARDQIEEFRRNEANMTAKERRQFKSQINRTETEIEKMGVDAAEKMYGYKREDAKSVFAASTQERFTKMEIEGRENAARIAAGPGYERNKILRDAQGQEAKVRAEYGKVQAKVMDILSKDQDYMMAEPAKKQLMQTAALRNALMNNPFLASYASGIGFSSAPTGGKVYDLTEE